MFRELLHRGISVAAALTVLVSSIAIGTSAQGTQGATEVYPLLPMSVAAAGGLNAGFKSSDRLFAKAEVAVVSADTPVINNAESIAASASRLIMNGFSQKMTDVSHILVYVKLNKANTITLNAEMLDDYYKSTGIPNLVLKSGAPYEVMARGAQKWSTAQTVTAGNSYAMDGGLKFDSAFEGYVKIPLTSLKEETNNIAVLPEIDYITGVTFRFSGVGGEYGNVEILPYLVVKNGGSEIRISDDYKEPESGSTAAVVTPVTEVTRNKNSWATVRGTEVTPRDFTRAFGVKMSPASGEYTEAANGNTADGQVYTGFIGDKLSASGSQGIVFYIKTDAANTVVPKFDISFPDDTARWSKSWAPILSLGVGSEYGIMPLTGGEWKIGTAVSGRPGNNTYFGGIELDGAFEGYIKIPYSSLANDSGFLFDASLDAFDRFTFNFRGIGGNCGEPVVGPVFFLNTDGTAGLKLNEGEPVKVTPLTGGNWRNFGLTENTYDKTVDLTDEKGMVMQSSGGYEFEGASMASSKLLSSYYAPDGTELSNSEGLLVYMKLEKGNSFMPVIDLKAPADKSRWNRSYAPALLLKVGSTYQYLLKNGDKWRYGTAGVGKQGDGTYWGTVDFAEGFEGYVLLPYSSLVNDSGFKFDASLDSLTNFTLRIKGIGGNYGENITVGPLFKVNKNSDSAKIEIYKDDTPESTVRTKIYPIGGGYSVSGMSFKEITPLKPVKLTAYSLTSGTPVQSVTMKLGAQGCKAENGDGFMLYASVPESSALSVSVSAAAELALAGGKSIGLLEKDGTEWNTVSVSADGTVNFEKAFEGWVKIPYDAFAAVPQGDISEITAVLSKSGKFNSAILGAVSLYKNDSDSADIEYPSEYLPENPKERIDYILERSQKGIADANYFMVGDSTRHQLGSPVFRLVRDTFVNEYNVNCYLQALTGLKTEYWCGRSPELQPGSPTVEELIEKIPGTGYNCIVDISLGINDSDKSADEMAGYLYEGINKIRAAKPDVTVIYTSPNRLNSKDRDPNVEQCAEIISQDSKIYFIDVHSGVMDDTYFGYYSDAIHPNINGYRVIAAYIKSCLFKGYTYEKISSGTVKSSTVILPSDAKINDSYSYRSLSAGNVVSSSKTNVRFEQNGKGFEALGVAVTAREAYRVSNDKAATLTKIMRIYDLNITGEGFAFYVKMQTANGFALSPQTAAGKERMLRANQYFQYLRAGETEWHIGITKPGRPGNENYGTLSFDEPFEGFVYIPVSSLYYGSAKDTIEQLNFRFSALDTDEPVIVAPMAEFTDIVPVDTESVFALPDTAEVNTSKLSVTKTYNLTTLPVKMTVGNRYAGGMFINGTLESNAQYPFQAKNFVETHLSEDMTGSDYITFHIKLPSANKLGVTAFTNNGEKENIFKNKVGYYVLPDGETVWQKRVSTDGRSDGSETYGSLEFDGVFSGFVRLPLGNFYGSPSKNTPINKVTVRFARLGGSYGEVKLGAFLNMNEIPYRMKNVWKTSDLPEMTPFTDVTKLDGHYAWVSRQFISSPVPTLNPSEKAAAKISCSPVADYGRERFMNSVHWMGMSYNNMPIGNFTHLVFYVKVPKTKTNYLSLCMFTDTRFEFKVMVDMPYQLMAAGDNKWQHFTALKTINSYGGIELPAGFEGLVKVPIDSLLPSNKVDSKTVLSEVTYRFAYCGTDDESVLVGPMFGVTKDNDSGPDEVVLGSMPEHTTIKSLFAVDMGDIFKDRIMLYWEEYPEADHYIMEAYEIIDDNGVKKYKLVSSSKAFTNSGTVSSLEPNTKYALLIKAYSYDNRLIAVYDYITVKTAEKDPYALADLSDKFEADRVYYPASGKADASGKKNAVFAAAGIGAAVIVAAGALLVIIKKRGHKADA